ncbi:MAG: polysaccharide deacetylase family protein [Cyclobacteriaceae bacterium]|nr:polysaccharide deacetylase family protein [Cyclobacteriaceae bacterium]
MKIKTLIALAVLLYIHSQSTAQPEKISWPDGAKAAICLTYDDAMETHLDIAIPDLNQYGLRGTFFLQGDNIMIDRIWEWRQASLKGHELGNHTAFHPCSEKLDFITPEFAAENYTVDRFLRELEVMNTLLFAIDGKKERTYAYTCGQTEFGGVSIIDTLRISGLFFAARGSGRGIVEDFRTLDPFNVPSGGYEGIKGSEMIGYIEKAEQAGGLGVFTFHGVGGQYISVTREAHQELLSYLSENRDKYWIAPFHEVMKHVISERKRIGRDE